MMMEPSAGINFDAGNMLIGLELHWNGATGSSLNNRGLILLLWEYPVWASYVCICVFSCCFLLCPHTSKRHRVTLDELWYLTPVSLCFYVHTHTFIFRVAAFCWGQAECQQDFNEKDIAQTPSMFPPCIHHRPADSWPKRTPSWLQHIQACARVTVLPNSSAGICFWTQSNNVNEGLYGGRDWRMMAPQHTNTT